MDKKSKIFFLVFFLLIIGSVLITFVRYYLTKDYYIFAEAECDPTTESCFVRTCDPESDAECPADESERMSYYKKVSKKAYLVPLCDPDDETCDALTCEEGADCLVAYCTDSDVSDGEACNDPQIYKEENSPSENECAPDDEGCQVEVTGGVGEVVTDSVGSDLQE